MKGKIKKRYDIFSVSRNNLSEPAQLVRVAEQPNKGFESKEHAEMHLESLFNKWSGMKFTIMPVYYLEE